jgi:hypothetical protein
MPVEVSGHRWGTGIHALAWCPMKFHVATCADGTRRNEASCTSVFLHINWEKTSHSLPVGAILHVLCAERDKTLAGVVEIALLTVDGRAAGSDL